MFIVRLTYIKPLEEVDQFLLAHREFLDYYYKQGFFIMSGPLKPRTGGIIIADTQDRAYLEKILNQDPFTLAGVATYEFLEFIPIKYCKELKALLEKTEGAL
jgi:uncharacterized protein YciI